MVVRSVNLISRIEKTRGTVLFHLGRNRVISAGNWKLIEPSSDEKCLMSNVQWHGKKDGNVESIMFHRPPFIFPSLVNENLRWRGCRCRCLQRKECPFPDSDSPFHKNFPSDLLGHMYKIRCIVNNGIPSPWNSKKKRKKNHNEQCHPPLANPSTL